VILYSADWTGLSSGSLPINFQSVIKSVEFLVEWTTKNTTFSAIWTVSNISVQR